LIDFDLIAWDDEDDPRGNVQHIATNSLTTEQVLHDPANRPTGRFRGDRHGQRHTCGLWGLGDRAGDRHPAHHRLRTHARM